jgi:hypothetical protein
MGRAEWIGRDGTDRPPGRRPFPTLSKHQGVFLFPRAERGDAEGLVAALSE